MVALDWWPVTRDCVAYGFTVVLLILTLQDGRVEWYEALLLVSVYLLYLLSEHNLLITLADVILG